jgi:hypothetical protein
LSERREAAVQKPSQFPQASRPGGKFPLVSTLLLNLLVANEAIENGATDTGATRAHTEGSRQQSQPVQQRLQSQQEPQQPLQSEQQSPKQSPQQQRRAWPSHEAFRAMHGEWPREWQAVLGGTLNEGKLENGSSNLPQLTYDQLREAVTLGRIVGEKFIRGTGPEGEVYVGDAEGVEFVNGIVTFGEEGGLVDGTVTYPDNQNEADNQNDADRDKDDNDKDINDNDANGSDKDGDGNDTDGDGLINNHDMSLFPEIREFKDGKLIRVRNPSYGEISKDDDGDHEGESSSYEWEWVDKIGMDKESVDKESRDKESVDKESVDKESVDKESVHNGVDKEQTTELIKTVKLKGAVFEGKFSSDEEHFGALVEGRKILPGGEIHEGIFSEQGSLMRGRIRFPDGEVEEGEFDWENLGTLLNGTIRSAETGEVMEYRNGQPPIELPGRGSLPIGVGLFPQQNLSVGGSRKAQAPGGSQAQGGIVQNIEQSQNRRSQNNRNNNISTLLSRLQYEQIAMPKPKLKPEVLKELEFWIERRRRFLVPVFGEEDEKHAEVGMSILLETVLRLSVLGWNQWKWQVSYNSRYYGYS